uniref:EGF-like domain-containing protein n=1 Tax=Hucho hucho TaxID=62062 RepID=A0A4W5QL20_9TELE
MAVRIDGHFSCAGCGKSFKNCWGLGPHRCHEPEGNKPKDTKPVICLEVGFHCSEWQDPHNSYEPEHTFASTLERNLTNARNVSEGVCPQRNSSWSFLHCPKEDECANGHHHCNITQDCHDLTQGYHCTCKQGYVLSRVSGQCEPVCAQGCVNGTCVSPGVCQCHFGFVGDNCSSQCHCNKHSNCKGVSEPDKCLECKNNTM